jgi:hypothetical protein
MLVRLDLAYVVNESDCQLQLRRKALVQDKSVYFRIPFAGYERANFGQRVN